MSSHGSSSFPNLWDQQLMMSQQQQQYNPYNSHTSSHHNSLSAANTNSLSMSPSDDTQMNSLHLNSNNLQLLSNSLVQISNIQQQQQQLLQLQQQQQQQFASANANSVHTGLTATSIMRDDFPLTEENLNMFSLGSGSGSASADSIFTQQPPQQLQNGCFVDAPFTDPTTPTTID
ncbi:unnamed protein product [Ambrosiozyma monospora]|uniref:Unnamed protein product n=1 Tax=Ambrosiozyma monospora TaxID=43982 RepID=A0ACB5U8K7_AMBMO|nr:unnamed protein product [Ambrosiozyma monospora]